MLRGIVSVLRFSDSNVYRVKVERITNTGIKVNTYIADYMDLKKVTRLSNLSHKMDKLISSKLITARFAEKSHKNFVTNEEMQIIKEGLEI